jgi:hypothetical protein
VFQGSQKTTKHTTMPVVDTIRDQRNGSELTIVGDQRSTYTTQEVNSKEPLQSSMAEVPSRASNNDQPATQPTRNLEGMMVCDREGCGKVTFRIMSDWK